MSLAGTRSAAHADSTRLDADELLGLSERFALSCPAATVVVAAGGFLRTVNPSAKRLLGFGGDLVGRPARAIFGLGWRELEVIARSGDADLLADLPEPGSGAMRVRLEPIGFQGEVHGAVAFLEPAETKAVDSSRPRAEGFQALFGTDPALRAAKDAAERFADTLLPVLLLAETGTGKELMARAIHVASPRRREPFVAINCGALSPHLLESELFGYAPGAFTGAGSRGHDGKIGAARGGTLFLDEVAEMPGPLQALLLRVLEDGTYYRVGDNVPRQADVRLVCATCRDLPRLVAEGSFRQDLYYRINGACLSLPRVRERTDLPELIHYLLSQLAADAGERPPSMAVDTLERMLAYPWPGNVRQLKTALRHAMILSDGQALGLEHLPGEISGRMPGLGPLPSNGSTAEPADPAPASVHTVSVPTASVPTAPSPRRTLAQLEADRLRHAVESHAGNLTRAAAELGIARTTLYRRLRKHGFLPDKAPDEGAS